MTTPPPRVITVTFLNGGDCDLQGVIGVEQLVGTMWVAGTICFYPPQATAQLRYFSTYTGIPRKASVVGPNNPPQSSGIFNFSPNPQNPPQWDVRVDTQRTSAGLLPTATTVTTVASSSECIFSNEDTELEKFIIVPGELSTAECANGGYDEICVKTVFTQLKNYFYSEDIFGQIRDKFAAFYPAIAIEQRIVDSINRLVQRLLAGEITPDQFDELVKIDEKIFASQFAKDYVTNYVKLELDIQKYKYLLTE